MQCTCNCLDGVDNQVVPIIFSYDPRINVHSSSAFISNVTSICRV